MRTYPGRRTGSCVLVGRICSGDNNIFVCACKHSFLGSPRRNVQRCHATLSTRDAASFSRPVCVPSIHTRTDHLNPLTCTWGTLPYVRTYVFNAPVATFRSQRFRRSVPVSTFSSQRSRGKAPHRKGLAPTFSSQRSRHIVPVSTFPSRYSRPNVPVPTFPPHRFRPNVPIVTFPSQRFRLNIPVLTFP